MEKKTNRIVSSIILFCLFVVYTVLVKVVDVMPIGPENSEVGFASINGVFAKTFTYNGFWYQLTEYLGYMAIGVCLAFALLGLLQLIKGKSFKAVDKEIWVLAGFYVVVIAFYVLFEVLVINYRPIILEEGLEASYPSSHTVLAVSVFLSAVYEFETYIKNRNLKLTLQAVVIILAVLMVVGRMLSGVHWISDIIGGCLLAVSLVLMFVGVREKIK